MISRERLCISGLMKHRLATGLAALLAVAGFSLAQVVKRSDQLANVRELLGVVVSEKANKGIVVTSGRFTQDAKAFARANPQIELVDGPALAELIQQAQRPACADRTSGLGAGVAQGGAAGAL